MRTKSERVAGRPLAWADAAPISDSSSGGGGGDGHVAAPPRVRLRYGGGTIPQVDGAADDMDSEAEAPQTAAPAAVPAAAPLPKADSPAAQPDAAEPPAAGSAAAPDAAAVGSGPAAPTTTACQPAQRAATFESGTVEQSPSATAAQAPAATAATEAAASPSPAAAMPPAPAAGEAAVQPASQSGAAAAGPNEQEGAAAEASPAADPAAIDVASAAAAAPPPAASAPQQGGLAAERPAAEGEGQHDVIPQPAPDGTADAPDAAPMSDPQQQATPQLQKGSLMRQKATQSIEIVAPGVRLSDCTWPHLQRCVC